MLYFLMNAGDEVESVHPRTFQLSNQQREEGMYWLTRINFKTWRDADIVASFASRQHVDRHVYLATDSGPCVSPQYDVIRAPEVGQPISYGFNGDSYPDGFIARISPTFLKVVSTTGSVYFRYRRTGSWIKKGGTWCMMIGHHNERNPSF